MNLFPFIVIGLINGSMVGIIAGLISRGVSPGNEELRFRDSAFLGMFGSIAGNVVATVVNSQDGYLASGPSSLLFSIIGAVLAISAVKYAHLQTRTQQTSRSTRQN